MFLTLRLTIEHKGRGLPLGVFLVEGVMEGVVSRGVISGYRSKISLLEVFPSRLTQYAFALSPR